MDGEAGPQASAACMWHIFMKFWPEGQQSLISLVGISWLCIEHNMVY